jgi:hypothetical protein
MLIFTFELFIEISSLIHQILTNLGKFLLTIAGRGNNLGAKIVVEKCLVTVTGMGRPMLFLLILSQLLAEGCG